MRNWTIEKEKRKNIYRQYTRIEVRFALTSVPDDSRHCRGQWTELRKKAKHEKRFAISREKSN